MPADYQAEQFFHDALKRKQGIQQQLADATTQDVNQKSDLQAQADAAAQNRAALTSQTQRDIANTNEQGASARALLNANTQTGIAGIQDQGANYRTGLTTGTQRDIAGMENQLGRDRLTQQGTQFDQSLGLDTQKAQDTSYLKRLELTKPVTVFDDMGNRQSAPGINLTSPPNVGMASPFSPPPARRLIGGDGIDPDSTAALWKRQLGM
jgi:hypothetical protein